MQFSNQVETTKTHTHTSTQLPLRIKASWQANEPLLFIAILDELFSLNSFVYGEFSLEIAACHRHLFSHIFFKDFPLDPAANQL